MSAAEIIQIIVAVLLLASGALALLAAIGLLRMRHVFLRMHPPAMAYTLGTWCAALACILYFSLLAGNLRLQAWLIVILLALTTPITAILLSRATLFRLRLIQAPAVPPTLSAHPEDAPHEDEEDDAPERIHIPPPVQLRRDDALAPVPAPASGPHDENNALADDARAP